MRQLRLILIAIGYVCLSTSSYAYDTSNIQMSGFGTIGFAKALDADATFGEVDDDITSKQDSRLGVQFDAQLNKNTDFALQLTAKGVDDYDVQAEWAYLRFRMNEQTDIRVGKLRAPFYLYSEILEVGYAFPWVRLPVESYGQIPFTTYEGIDVVHKFSSGPIWFEVQPFFGSTDVDISLGQENIRDFMGLNVSASVEDWTVRLAYLRADLSIDSEILDGIAADLDAIGQSSIASDYRVKDINAQFYGLGLTGQVENLTIIAELTRREEINFVPESTGYYFSLAYGITDAVTPYFYFGENKSKKDIFDNIAGALASGPVSPVPLLTADFVSRSLADDQKSYAIGARWDVMPNVALKFEYQVIDPSDNFDGALDTPALSYDGKFKQVSTSIDFVF